MHYKLLVNSRSQKIQMSHSVSWQEVDRTSFLIWCNTPQTFFPATTFLLRAFFQKFTVDECVLCSLIWQEMYTDLLHYVPFCYASFITFSNTQDVKYFSFNKSLLLFLYSVSDFPQYSANVSWADWNKFTYPKRSDCPQQNDITCFIFHYFRWKKKSCKDEEKIIYC